MKLHNSQESRNSSQGSRNSSQKSRNSSQKRKNSSQESRKSPKKKCRKEIRKEKRDAKKQHRRDYYNRHQKSAEPLLSSTEKTDNINCNLKREMHQHNNICPSHKAGSENEQKVMWELGSNNANNVPNGKVTLKNKNGCEDPLIVRKLQEEAAHNALQKGMQETRNQQLKEANEEDEKLIRKLEKQLNMSKCKSKSLPKSFADDGLNYILDVCDSDKIRQVASIEKTFDYSDSELEEDLALVASKNEPITSKKQSNSIVKQNYVEKWNKDSDEAFSSNTIDSEISNTVNGDTFDCAESENFNEDSIDGVNYDLSYSEEEEHAISGENQRLLKEHNSDKVSKKVALIHNGTFEKKRKRVCLKKEEEEEEEDDYDHEELSCSEQSYKMMKMSPERKSQSSQGSAYVPPSLRSENASNDSLQRMLRLKRRVKGLLNRLSERNLCSISKEVSELYHDTEYSRNDMNTTLTTAIMESLVTPVLSLERLVMEHIALVAYLHYHEGIEIGAFILQTVVKKFDMLFKTNPDIENKELDNVILIMSFFYHFKVVHARLLFDMLSCLADRFGPKDLELILLMLRSVAFILRKDDPPRMKSLMIQLQELAVSSLQKCDEPRIKFMLQVLVAVKNNNVARLPGWDPTPVDNMRKLLRSLPSHQNGVTSELNASLKDILAADERGRWWIIGSAWVGKGPIESELPATKKVQSYSAELLDLAEKMRMNTSIRRNIFCVLMSSQDCKEAVANILQMGLKGIQAHEIVHVTLDCCLQEKEYNHFYSFVLQNFCESDRMYKITLQRDLWSKFDDLSSLKRTQFSNMVKLLQQLLNQEVINLLIFKVIDFTQLQKTAVRLLRQVLLGVLNGDEEICNQVFAFVTKNVKHKMFCKRLHLFLQQFVISRMAPDDPRKLSIKDRVNSVFLTTSGK